MVLMVLVLLPIQLLTDASVAAVVVAVVVVVRIAVDGLPGTGRDLVITWEVGWLVGWMVICLLVLFVCLFYGR